MKYETKFYRHTSMVQKVVRVLMGSFMFLAGISHLTFLRGEFQAQVPDWVPMSKDLVVIFSGIAEITLGLGMLFIQRYRIIMGIVLALFYIAVFPGNLHQYTHHLDAFGLDSDRERLIRLFFQPVLVVVALWCTGFFEMFKKEQSMLVS